MRKIYYHLNLFLSIYNLNQQPDLFSTLMDSIPTIAAKNFEISLLIERYCLNFKYISVEITFSKK